MSKLKKISIFIDSYNDVDHITPFVDYLLSNKKAKITLYKTKTSNLIGCEYHLQYLKEVYGLIPVYYDKDFSSMYIMLMSMYWKLCFFSNRAKRNSYLIPFLILFSQLRSIAMYLTYKEVSRIQKDIHVDIIMMDFGKELGLYGASIVKYVQDKPIKTVGYLHGLSIYTNVDGLQKDKVSLPPLKKFLLSLSKPKVKRSYFNRYVVGLEQKYTYFSSSMMAGYEKKYLGRIHELGMPRYTSEWIGKYRQNIMVRPDKFTYGDSKKTNVVLFLSHPKYNVCVSELMLTIKSLSSCNNINFVYKPHTRNGLDDIDNKGISGYDASEISSLELSSWADVGIVYGSSVAFQLLQDNVPLIMPKYVHLNSTIFEKNNVCIPVGSVDELINIFTKSKNEISGIVKQENINRFVKHYVYGRRSYNDLMNNFYQFSVNFD